MVLTDKEKLLLIRLLKKEKRKAFGIKENKKDVQQLLEKLEQNKRNTKVNEVNPSKL
ncbi:hypothetical protein LGQ02_09075 [Bacillus shivajii]|uniref:hypothetical protein n=1 Tax=Bacillus shivajii TaxID=1983719 RepID=UPI001CFA3D14|nr:hypothetical protein [Bacillus shivajii]UCZ54874.1 hypothetical protein LGQ02_09075 [Bacillus shivajii]